MSKCYIEKQNNKYVVIDAKYGYVQGEYPDDGFATIAAMRMGYIIVA